MNTATSIREMDAETIAHEIIATNKSSQVMGAVLAHYGMELVEADEPFKVRPKYLVPTIFDRINAHLLGWNANNPKPAKCVVLGCEEIIALEAITGLRDPQQVNSLVVRKVSVASMIAFFDRDPGEVITEPMYRNFEAIGLRTTRVEPDEKVSPNLNRDHPYYAPCDMGDLCQDADCTEHGSHIHIAVTTLDDDGPRSVAVPACDECGTLNEFHSGVCSKGAT